MASARVASLATTTFKQATQEGMMLNLKTVVQAHTYLLTATTLRKEQFQQRSTPETLIINFTSRSRFGIQQSNIEIQDLTSDI